MKIQKITDEAFKKYGKVLAQYDCAELIREMEHTPLPEDVIYVPSVEELEVLSVARDFQNSMYGGLPIQIGYCNGHNHTLNALEYHRSSEVNVAVTDLILLLGAQQDIKEDDTYDTSLVEAFLVPAGTAIEVYATTLHYAPCSTDQQAGFRVAVVLPRGTNLAKPEIECKNEEDRMLFAANKWLLAHPDAPEAKNGAYVGLTGENIDIADFF